MRRRDQELLPPHRLPRKPLVVGGRDDGKARDSYAWSQGDDKSSIQNTAIRHTCSPCKTDQATLNLGNVGEMACVARLALHYVSMRLHDHRV